MPTFSYIGRSRSGKQLTGELMADNKNEAIAALRKQHILVTTVKEKAEEKKIFGRAKVKPKEVAVVTRQLSFMIDAGLPLNQALEILASQADNKALQKTLFELRQSIEGGSSFSDALGEHPNVFSDLYVNMVAAGEVGGILDVILLRLAAFMEKNDALARKIKGAMVYPGVIMGVAVAAVAILLIVVIPTFQSMFEGAGVPLPGPTLFVIWMSETLQAKWWLILAVIAGLVFAFRQYYKTDQGQLVMDRLFLRSPVFGNLLRKTAVARFTRTLGTLVASGVSILEGLEITAKTAGNRVIHDAVMESRSSIAGGETISEPLKRSGVFPPMVVQMIHVGEQTGGLDEMLSKIADFYDEEVDAAVEALLAAMEPIMIVFLGTIVGGMIVAMYLPIFDMMNAVEG